MTLTKFLVLGSAVTGVVLLSNKERRDRLLTSAKDFIDHARRRIEVQSQPVDVGTGTGTSSRTTAPDYPTPT